MTLRPRAKVPSVNHARISARVKMALSLEPDCQWIVMAGHSKWANIQHRKGRQDAMRGKYWTKNIREITVAAREGGPDPDANPRMRHAGDTATAANMPKHNIQRAIQRGSRGADGDNYEEIRYEGDGAGGAAV